MSARTLSIWVAILGLAWLGLCPGAVRAAAVAVEVDDTAFTVGDVERRVRDIHRAKPRMRASGDAAQLSVHDIVDDLVDEHLLAREAEAMGLGDEPDFRRRLDAYERDRAIVMLYAREVESRSEPTQDEIRARYAAMQDRDVDSVGELPESLAGRIAAAMRRERGKALADAFVEGLRAKAAIEIDRERIEVLGPGLDTDSGTGNVAVVDGVAVPMGVFLDDLRRERRKAGNMLDHVADPSVRDKWFSSTVDRVLEALVVNALVGAEATRRGYREEAEVALAVVRRRRAMLLRAFRERVLEPLAEPTREELEAYYATHAAQYVHGCEVRLGELRFKDRTDAEATLRELRGGAVFGSLAKVLGGRSTFGSGWVSESALPVPFQEALGAMDEGDVSEVVSLGRDLAILKLRARRGCEVAPLADVAADVERRVRAEKYLREKARYAAALRAHARVVEHAGVIDDLEKRFWSAPDGAQRGEP